MVVFKKCLHLLKHTVPLSLAELAALSLPKLQEQATVVELAWFLGH